MVSIKVNVSKSLKTLFEKDLLKSNLVRLTFREQLEKIVEKAKTNHRYTSRTGKLDQSVEQKLESDTPLRGLIQINPQCKYGVFIHEGTRRHFVKPMQSKALRFTMPNGNRFFFSKGHFVDGIKPDPFVEQAVKNQLPEFEKELNIAIHKELDS